MARFTLTTAATTAACTVGLVATLGLASRSAAQDTTIAAESVLLGLDESGVPARNIPAYQGELGHLTQPPGNNTVTWDQSDPDGVLAYVGGWSTPSPPPGTTTLQVADSAGSRQASADWSGFGVRLVPNSGPNIVSFGSLRTWARCTHDPLPTSAEASAVTGNNAVYLFNNTTDPLSEGANYVTATGEQLGIPDVSTADLTVTVHHVEESTDTSAHAAVTVDIAGELRDSAGNTIHNGHLSSINAGDVRVDCADEEPPPTSTTEPPPTSTTEPPPTSTTEPPPTSTTEPPPTSTTEPPPTSTTEPPPTSTTEPPPTSTTSSTPVPPSEQPGGPPPGVGHPDLPQTGWTPWPWVLAAAGLVVVGTTGIVVARRR